MDIQVARFNGDRFDPLWELELTFQGDLPDQDQIDRWTVEIFEKIYAHFLSRFGRIPVDIQVEITESSIRVRLRQRTLAAILGFLTFLTPSSFSSDDFTTSLQTELPVIVSEVIEGSPVIAAEIRLGILELFSAINEYLKTADAHQLELVKNLYRAMLGYCQDEKRRGLMLSEFEKTVDDYVRAKAVEIGSPPEKLFAAISDVKNEFQVQDEKQTQDEKDDDDMGDTQGERVPQKY